MFVVVCIGMVGRVVLRAQYVSWLCSSVACVFVGRWSARSRPKPKRPVSALQRVLVCIRACVSMWCVCWPTVCAVASQASAHDRFSLITLQLMFILFGPFDITLVFPQERKANCA